MAACLLVGPLDRHAPVKAAGAQQGGIQHVWPVGGRNADDQLPADRKSVV